MTDGAENSRVQPAEATLYRAAISLGTQETQLIWTRFTGFVVINGFLINAVVQWPTSHASVGGSSVLLVVAIFGLLLNTVWHILNFAGWQNQNLWYHYASGLIGDTKLALPTDQFKEKIRCPFGWIYWLAQSVPKLFFLGSTSCLYFALLECGPYLPVVAAVLSLVACSGFALATEYFVIAREVGLKKAV